MNNVSLLKDDAQYSGHFEITIRRNGNYVVIGLHAPFKLNIKQLKGESCQHLLKWLFQIYVFVWILLLGHHHEIRFSKTVYIRLKLSDNKF